MHGEEVCARVGRRVDAVAQVESAAGVDEGRGEVDVAVVVVEGARDRDVEGREVPQVARLAVDALEAGVVLVSGEVAEDNPVYAKRTRMKGCVCALMRDHATTQPRTNSVALFPLGYGRRNTCLGYFALRDGDLTR